VFPAEKKGGELDERFDGAAAFLGAKRHARRAEASEVSDVGVAHTVGEKRHDGQAFGLHILDDGRFRGGVVVDPEVAREKHAHAGRVGQALGRQIPLVPGVESLPVGIKRFRRLGVPESFPGLADGRGRGGEILPAGQSGHGTQQVGEIFPPAVDHVIVAAPHHRQRRRGMGPQRRIVA